MRLPRSLHATRAGWCFMAIVFGVGFAALNTGNNLLYLVLALLLAFLVLSGLLSEASLRGMRVERRIPRELFAHGPNRISLRIFNDHSRAPSFAVSIEDQIEGEAKSRFAGRVFVLRIGANESVDRSYVFEPENRGDLRFTNCRLSTRFPFGLFVKSLDIPLESQSLVYPQVAGYEPDGAAAHTPDDGTQTRRVSKEGDEWSGVREYRRGDTIRRIHWRRSLRTRKLIVGDRESQAFPQVEVRLRLPATLDTRQVEDRVAQATFEVVKLLAEGYRVGLRSSRERIEPDSGFAHRTGLLSFLARVAKERSARNEIPRPSAPR